MTGITTLVTLPYMQRFRCIAERCEDSCCIGWEIWVDEAKYRQLESLLGCNDEDRALFREGLSVPGVPTGAAQEFAKLTMHPDGRCWFLDARGLCVLESRFGPRALGAVCRMHPRTVRKRGTTMELSASLSCPEAARLCLFGPPFAGLLRGRIDSAPGEELAAGPAPDALETARLDVRDRVLAALADATRPVAARLAESFGIAGGAPVADRPGAGSGHAFVAALVARLRAAAKRPRLLALLDLARATDDDARRTAALRAGAVGERLDRARLHFAANAWLREDAAATADLARHALQILARTALIRVLAAGHPDLDGACDGRTDGPAATATAERVIVSVVTTLGRELENVPALAGVVGEALDGSPFPRAELAEALAAL